MQVPTLGLGTFAFGGFFGPVATAEAHEILRRSRELGVTLFDTAPQYGYGVAEQRIGEVLASLPRDDIVLATKVGRALRPASLPTRVRRTVSSAVRRRPAVSGPELSLDSSFDFSYDGAMRSFESSLKRLNVDRVDIAHIHDPDDHYDEALSGALRALDKLRAEGVVRAVGVGMNQAAMLARFAREASVDCFLVAGRYTLLDQSALRELLPLCVEREIAVTVGGVFNSGVLVNPSPGALFDYARARRKWLRKAQRLKAVCDRHNVPLAAAALQFPLAHPAVKCVLTGVRSVAELGQNVSMFKLEIPPDLWNDLRDEELLPRDAPVPVSPD